MHCGLTDPSQTAEVQQALSYQPDKAMTGAGPTFSLDRLTKTSQDPACLPPLTLDKVPSSFTPASLETALLLPSPAHWLHLLPAGLWAPLSSSLHLCLPATTSPSISCRLPPHLIALHTPFPLPAALSLHMRPSPASSVLLSMAALQCPTAFPSWRSPGTTADLEFIGLLNDDF